MSKFKNLRCGNCKASFTEGYIRTGTIDNFTRLGPEFLTCTLCGCKNKTNRIPYSKMRALEKYWVLFSFFLTNILFGGMFGFFLFVGIDWILKKFSIINESGNPPTIYIVIAVVVTAIIFSYYQLKGFFKDIKDHDYY